MCGHPAGFATSRRCLRFIILIMGALWNRAGHYIFALWFLLLSSFFFPRLISAVAKWMSTVLLHIVWPYCEFRMQVWNVLRAARWKYRTQKWRKNRHLGTMAQLYWAVSSQLRHIDNRKNLLSSNTSSTCPRNMVNFGPLTAEISSGVWAPLQISTGFASWQRYCTALQYWASAKLCGVEQRAPLILDRAAITSGIGPHSSSGLFTTRRSWDML